MLVSALTLAKVAILGVWLPAFAVGERLRPLAARPAGADRRRLVRNLGLWLGNTAMSPLLTAPITLAAASLHLWQRPLWGPPWAMLALDLVLLDLWIYWWHRLNHEASLLWRFHQVHHRDEFLDVSSGLRFHPGEVLASALVRGVFVAAAAMPLQAVAVYEIVLLAAASFHHSNLRLPAGLERLLRAVVVTPSHHWVHHHAVRRDTDSNYGALLSVWDRLFGSFSATARTPQMPIGLEGARDETLAGLVLLPFQPQRIASASVSTQSSL